MRLIRRMLYNASLVSLFQELYKKYPYPIVIYDNSTDDERFDFLSTMTVFNNQWVPKNVEYNYADDFEASDIYQTIAVINSQWISKSLTCNSSTNEQRSIEIKSLHVFCVESILDSVYLIADHILRTSNSYRIQNIIFFNDPEPPLSVRIFEEHERFHRNTILCQRSLKIITCWYWAQQIDRLHATLTDLLNEPINLNLSVIQINAQTLPPHAYIACLSGRNIFTGTNSMVAAEILSKFNATPRYCNEEVAKRIKAGICHNVNKMNEDDALKVIRRLKVRRKGDRIFFNINFDPRMIRYLFFGTAECEGASDLNMHMEALNENSNMTALVPTELSCISVIVPRTSAASSFIRRTFYESVESIAIYCTVLLFTIARILISKSPFTQWFNIFYSTFVVYLNQTRLKPRTEAERVLYGFLFVLSVTTTIMLSSLIYTNMVNNPSSKPIQTVNDLAESKYKIYALDNAGNWMESLREDIREKLIVVNDTVIVAQLISQNNTAALAINDNLLGVLKPTWDSLNLDPNFRNEYYQMREKLHCGYFAYRISDDLALEKDINRIILQMVEHGFISVYKKRSMYLLKLANLFRALTKDKGPPINFGSNHGIYYVYFSGIMVSVAVFLCERLYKWVQKFK